MALIAKFHRAANIKQAIDLDLVERRELIRLRMELIAEEHDEVQQELDLAAGDNGNIFALAKELADLLVVVYGTAELFNIPLETVYEEVMMSNLSKTVDCTWRHDGKLLKGPHYEPPNIVECWETESKY
jgi:predicted HAD superfamily Cof-like phosphohydrolase